MENESIDIVDFINARAKEINAIENSINSTTKKSMLFQRVPFYKRRRNRNYDKRINKKFTYRKKDRHFLRTHTFYAKRFFMLKAEHFSIPLERRIKSSKYIYKSQGRGFIFDESFRKIYIYRKGEVYNFIYDDQEDSEIKSDNDLKNILLDFDFNKKNIIQPINNEFEMINDGQSIISIGKEILKEQTEEKYCSISVLMQPLNTQIIDKYSKAKVFTNNNSERIEKCKILCLRSEIMNIFNDLIKQGFIPICLNEIHRIALENDQITIYDNIKSDIYKNIEDSVNKKIVEKYNRTPPAKKMSYDLSKLYLQNLEAWKYFVFEIKKGKAILGSEIFCNEKCVGRVLRSFFKYSSGKNFGLGFFTEEISSEITGLRCKNLAQSNFYEISIRKIF